MVGKGPMAPRDRTKTQRDTRTTGLGRWRSKDSVELFELFSWGARHLGQSAGQSAGGGGGRKKKIIQIIQSNLAINFIFRQSAGKVPAKCRISRRVVFSRYVD